MATETKTKKAPKTSDKMEASIYNMQGKETGKVTLPADIFGLPWNADLVHQVVTSMQDNARTPIAHTKGRGEVRGGGKKPWQQKGTGRARVGSSRSPIWKGGGVTHGPLKQKDYSRKINRAMRQKALLVTLSRKARDGELVLIDSLSIETPKTKTAQAMLMALGKEFKYLNKTTNAALVAIPTAHKGTMKSFGNISNIEMLEARNLNPVAVLGKKYLVIAEPAVAFEMLAKKSRSKSK
jgi:large subunit ribosomal protein L4